MNESNLIPDRFSWQVGYAAFSVSESTADRVYKYIKNQKAHHKVNTFQQEYEDFVKLYGFDEPQAGV